jgi:hypothetical protein
MHHLMNLNYYRLYHLYLHLLLQLYGVKTMLLLPEEFLLTCLPRRRLL